MKLNIDGKEYEISEECLYGLLDSIKKGALKADLSKEILGPLLELDSFSERSLKFFALKLRSNGINFYHALSVPKRLFAIQICRWLIAKFEMRMNNPEAAKVIRPPRRKDPIEHIIGVFYPIIADMLIPEIARLKEDAIIEIATEDTTITSCKLTESRSGREMAINGY